jgi:hypothetical protein
VSLDPDEDSFDGPLTEMASAALLVIWKEEGFVVFTIAIRVNLRKKEIKDSKSLE